MPNRYVRESAIESERVDRLTWPAEVFYRRLINRVDDFGRFTANLELLRASLFPLRVNKVPAADVGKWLSECETADLVSTWKAGDGKHYLVMHRWEKGRAKFSKYPDPPEAIDKRLHTDANIFQQVFANAPDSDPDSDPDIVKKGASRFKPPTIDEIREYCQSRKNAVSPEKFQAYYQANGWKVGRNSMKDWKAAVRTWESNGQRHAPAETGSTLQPDFIRSGGAA